MHTLWKILAGAAMLYTGIGILIIAMVVISVASVLFPYFFGPDIEDKYGLIDQQGKFVVKPDFVYITAPTLADTYVEPFAKLAQ